MKFVQRARAGPEINLTSMIDVLFIVLMFLLLTTTFREFTFIPVQLPVSETAERDARESRERIEILIEESGTLFLGERPITLDELDAVLRAVRDKPQAEVVLTADARLDHGRVVEVMDHVRRAGIYRLGIVTVSATKR